MGAATCFMLLIQKNSETNCLGLSHIPKTVYNTALEVWVAVFKTREDLIVSDLCDKLSLDCVLSN